MNEIGKNLRRVRLLKNLSLKEAGNLLNMSAPAVAKYEKGETLPDSEKLIEFAKAYEVKVIEILKSYKIPQMKFTSFRKRKRYKGKKLDLLKEIIQQEVAKNLEVNEMNNIIKKRINIKKYSCKTLEDAENIANKFRNNIEYSLIQPMSDLINILENMGILIILIENKNHIFDDFDGLSETVNDIPVIILLDGIEDGARQRFTIAHELGHLILDIADDEMDHEKMCNRFASSLLMPKDAVINEFGSSRSNISIYELTAFKREYKVSYAAIIYRLKDLNIITEYTYKKLSIWVNTKIGKRDPDPIEPEMTYHFRRIVHKLETDNVISLNKACELLGASTDEYYKENNNYGY